MANVVTVEVIADVKKLTDGVGQVNQSLGSVEKAARSSGSILKGALGASAIEAGLGKAKEVLGDAFETVKQQELLGKQTEAVLKSTGAAAGVSAAGVKELSESLEANSMIEAEAIHKGQNLLLTFTKIQNKAGEGNDIYDRATKAMVDMSTAMGTDTSTSAMQLGKALNDPIKGMSQLGRVGVQFTAAQKEQAEQMMKTGNVAGAQQIILAELEKQFGGSAAASANTFAGAMFQVEDTLMGVLEEGLSEMIPVIKTLAQWLQNNLPIGIDMVKDAFGELDKHLGPVKAVLGAVLGFIEDNPETVQAFAIALGVMAVAVGIVTAAQWLWNAAMTANPIGLIIVGIAALVAAIVWVATNFEQVTKFFGDLWNNIAKSVTDGWNWFVEANVTAATAIIGWFGELPGKILGALNALGQFLSKAATDAWSAFATANIKLWTIVGAWFAGIPGRVLGAMAALVGFLGGLAGRAWQAFSTANIRAATTVMTWFAGIPSRVTGALGDLANLLWQHGKGIIDGLLRGLQSAWSGVTDFVGGIGSWIANNKGPIEYDKALLVPAGVAIMAGLIGGLTSQVPVLKDTLASITGTIAGTSGNIAAPKLTANVTAATDSTASAITREPAPTATIVINLTTPTATAETGRIIAESLNRYLRAGGRLEVS